MLSKVEYADYERLTLNTIDERILKEHEKQIADKLREDTGLSRTWNDLKEIVEGRKTIQKLLTGRVETLSINDESYKDFITHKHKSRAVKKITIYSPKLKDLKNVVIYDLPGFDSPTYIHSKYTIESLKKADAVVYIRIADKPSLTGPETDILKKVYEEDGVPIKKKLFIFANKADNIYERDEYLNARRKLIEELKKHDLFTSEDRIVFGSARAHLEGGKALENLRNLGLDTGIEEIRRKIIDYNNTERAELLKIRVRKVLLKLNELIEELVKSIETTEVSEVPEEYLEIYEEVKEYLIKALDKFINEFKNNLAEDVPIEKRRISNDLKKVLSGVVQNIRQEEVEDIKNQIKAGNYTPEERPDEFNMKVRERISKSIRRNFHNEVQIFLKDFMENFKNEIINIFIETMGISEENRNIMKDEVAKFIEDIVHFSEMREIASFQMLVDRFSGDIRETLMIPLSTKDRENKFRTARRDILSTLIFHDAFEDFLEDFSYISKITEAVFLEQYPLSSVNKESIKSLLREILEKANINIEIDERLLRRIFEIMIRRSLPLDALRGLSGKNVQNFNDILSLISSINNDFIITRDRPETYEEVLEEIERDLENLRSIVENAVVNAVNAEKVVKVYITDIVNLIKESIIGEEKYKFRKFFHNNRKRIRKLSDILREFEVKKKNYEERKRYKSKLENLYDKLQKIIIKTGEI